MWPSNQYVSKDHSTKCEERRNHLLSTYSKNTWTARKILKRIVLIWTLRLGNHNVQIYQCIPNVLQVEQSQEAIMLEQFVI